MHHIFIHSSIKGHLGCFHVLAIANSTTVNTGVQCILLDHVFLCIYAQGGIAGSCGGSIFTFFKETPYYSP